MRRFVRGVLLIGCGIAVGEALAVVLFVVCVGAGSRRRR